MRFKIGFLSVLALSALTSISTPVFARGGGSSVGPANPAAMNCLVLGGELENYTTEAGENANCVIEEWTLFKEMNDRGLVKPHQYGPGVGMPNPAAVNCIDIGGDLRAEAMPTGETSTFCVVEQWTLFNTIDAVTGR
ncbi:MAG: DUF333 domain-containing protein [Deltaproteobacteria bacterium]|jgi:putative hemolysin|nr:DUF333 domain-containing protein [Deltaproteobacteria bacterium]